MAIIKVKWTVRELANVLTLFDVQKVYRSTTGESGPYVEITTALTRVPLVVDQTDYLYDDTAGDPLYWYRVAYFNSTTLLESEKSEPIQGTGGGLYVTVADMRDAGIADAPDGYDDAQVLAAIELAEDYVHKATGRWFYPAARTLEVDGNGSSILQLGVPIVQVDAVEIVSAAGDGDFVTTPLELSTLRVYNRHLTQGLTNPDDRDAARIVFEGTTLGAGTTVSRFYEGRKNVRVQGVFGYTTLRKGDAVGETSPGSQVPLSQGSAPHAIVDVVKRLVVSYVIPVTDREAIDDESRRGFITRMKTRDQEIQWAAGAVAQSGLSLTGDRYVDRVLAAYKRPAQARIV